MSKKKQELGNEFLEGILVFILIRISIKNF